MGDQDTKRTITTTTVTTEETKTTEIAQTGTSEPAAGQPATCSSSGSDSSTGPRQNPVACQHNDGTTTPPRQSRARPGPARPQTRRNRHRRRTNRTGQPCRSTYRRLFDHTSQSAGNQSEDAIGADAAGSTCLAGVPLSRPLQSAPETQAASAAATESARTLTSNPAVRVLFREQRPQLLRQQQVISEQVVPTTSSPRINTGTCTEHNQNQNRTGTAHRPLRASYRPPISIIEANRRMIERQIEAIREADSRRWNFDFGTCQPLHQMGHRYVDCTTTNLNSHGSNATNNNTNSNPPTSTGSNSSNAGAVTPLRNLKPLNDKNQTQDH